MFPALSSRVPPLHSMPAPPALQLRSEVGAGKVQGALAAEGLHSSRDRWGQALLSPAAMLLCPHCSHPEVSRVPCAGQVSPGRAMFEHVSHVWLQISHRHWSFSPGDDKQKSPQTISTSSKLQPGGTGTDPCKSYRCTDEPVPHELSAEASC